MRSFVFQGARVLTATDYAAGLTLWVLICILMTSWNDARLLQGAVRIFSDGAPSLV